ncbi:MAG: peptidase dimerization domain-containing protein [Armatimonadota bacterium]|nr:peptidase dimerization domain-containing protein [Armatimonadota bacterium]MDR7486986.1 peptidase dimerization domain-containing protein [Armatimonadota bacterium]MDR7536162.1 peptidase dimerization domain-containing protein [Armatimonadota bacterium]
MVETLIEGPETAAHLAALDAHVADVVEEAVKICEIPAPPFQEERRAAYVAARMQELGLGTPRRDAVGNVICELPGDPHTPAVVVSAHLDTVFGPEVEIRVRRDGPRLAAPGIGDNSIAVAGLLWLGRVLATVPGRGTLVLAANVGEEGLGNLRGMRALWDQYGARAGAWVVLEGAMFNQPSCAGICVRRLEVTYHTAGGHSWSDFGQPSAIHALGRLIDQLAQVRVPPSPRTTYNVGVVRGGRTVNTIAPEAALLLDLRSEEPSALDDLDRIVRGLVSGIAAAAGVDQEVTVVSDRPGGRLPPDHPLVRLVEAASAAVGAPPEWKSASTDANVPLSRGAAAVCLGLARGEHLHAEAESLDVTPLPRGLRQAYLVTAALLRGALPAGASR